MFQKATKKKSKARIAITGPSGSGKTYSALRIANGLGGPIAVIDTENGSASLYADEFQFDVVELKSHDPARYIEAIQAAAKAGYNVVIIDSLSHAWMGRDGALEKVDQAAARNKGNSFAGWRDVTPLHNRLVDTLTGTDIHVIATMRSKTEWVIEENDRGKKTPRKIGTAPIMRDGIEYEFTLCGDIDHEHKFVISKSRCKALADKVFDHPGEDLASVLLAWLTSGETPAAPPAAVTPEQLVEIGNEVLRLGWERKAAAAKIHEWTGLAANALTESAAKIAIEKLKAEPAPSKPASPEDIQHDDLPS